MGPPALRPSNGLPAIRADYPFDPALGETRRVAQSDTAIRRASDEDEGAVAAVPPGWTWERALPWVMALVFAGLYATLSVARLERLAIRSFDLGIFEQAIRHYAHFQAPIVDLEGAGHNFLGDHWNPAIVVFAPFYRLFPSPVTLLVGQALVIALGVVPITRAGMRHVGRWSGVAVGLAFGVSYGIQSAVDFDVHDVCLAVPLLAFALEAYLAGRWRRVVFWAAPLVLVKEDLGLTVALLGVVLILVGARRWGVGLGVFGLASLALTVKVLIPYFNAEGRVGSAKLAALPGTGNLLQRVSDLALQVLTPGPKMTTVLLLLVVTAFLSLRSPLLILVLPTLAWRLISTNQNFGGQSFHYDLVLMPIIFAALIDGVVRAGRGRWRPLRWYARAAPALALAVGLFFCTRYAFKDLVVPATYQPSARAQGADRVLSRIPDGATVESDLGLIAKLTNRTRVFYVGSAAPVVPQFFLVDDKAGWNPPLSDPVRYAESLHSGATYVLVTGGDGYRLLRRVG
jgi:uncharacterized membrane protein